MSYCLAVSLLYANYLIVNLVAGTIMGIVTCGDDLIVLSIPPQVTIDRSLMIDD